MKRHNPTAADKATEILLANLARLQKPRKAKATLRRTPDPCLRRVLSALVAARIRAGLTQQQVASKMRTTASAISRLEAGKVSRPTLTTIENYAMVTGCQVNITVREKERIVDGRVECG